MLRTADSVIVDIDVLEKGLVHPTPDLVGRSHVRAVAVLDEAHEADDVVFDHRGITRERLESRFNLGERSADCGLFFSVERGGHEAVEMAVQQLFAAGQKLALLFEERGASLRCVPVLECHVFAKHRGKFFGLFGCEPTFQVQLLDHRFDLSDWQGWQITSVPLLVAAAADEVAIRGSVSIRRVLDDQPLSAAAAVDGALEVVGVLPCLLARCS